MHDLELNLIKVKFLFPQIGANNIYTTFLGRIKCDNVRNLARYLDKLSNHGSCLAEENGFSYCPYRSQHPCYVYTLQQWIVSTHLTQGNHELIWCKKKHPRKRWFGLIKYRWSLICNGLTRFFDFTMVQKSYTFNGSHTWSTHTSFCLSVKYLIYYMIYSVPHDKIDFVLDGSAQLQAKVSVLSPFKVGQAKL